MIHQVWRLSEPGDHNLGLACTEEGLLLGRTPLIERRNGRFAVRERSEIERLLSRAYRAELPLERLMAEGDKRALLLSTPIAAHLEVPIRGIEKMPEALAYVESSRAKGKVVVTMS